MMNPQYRNEITRQKEQFGHFDLLLKEICTFSQLSEAINVENLKASSLAPVVQRLDNAIHRINYYPVDSVVQ